MRRFFLPMLITACMLIPFRLSVESQSFGKNKVNYQTFDWSYISTEHFDVYYTEGGYDLARIAGTFSEEAYESISNHWNHVLGKRIPIIVYNSHNDFSQTNVILEIIQEGTGGFTEIFKNRVVIPWEGSLPKFRHVIHHELTHAMYFDLLYGGLMESIVGREYLFQLPLWFAEGLAEHESQYWGTEADMILRDGIITGYIPQVQNIYGGYLAYKGGESFFRFIQEEYGNPSRWVAGEILQSLKNTKDLDQTYKSVLGKSLEDLSEEWHRHLRTKHWPEVAGREIADDFAQKLTDHNEIENYLNANPTFNPTGDKIAFLTDRNGYTDIMVMSAIDGKILSTPIRGEKAGDYEEMHWIRGGMSWSPDGHMLTFASKAGKRDALHIRAVDDEGYNKIFKPDTDALFSPDWSPDGSKILFTAIKDGKADLFTLDIETETYTRLTDDYFDESGARWNRDGTKIVFASDRKMAPYSLRYKDMTDNYDVFVMNADGTDVTRITTSPFNDSSPSWSPDGENIVFISDRNGISNLYTVRLADMTVTPLTNLLTSASTPHWSPDGTKIAFTSFKESGWDIFILKRPLKRTVANEDITPTSYRLATLENLANAAPDSGQVYFSDNGTGQQLVIDSPQSQDYSIKFTPDMLNAFASYNTFYGFGGMGELSFSDIMGNHRINVGANLFYSLEESDFMFSYYNLKYQTDFGIAGYHYKDYYRTYNWDIISDRIYGGSIMASRPFSRFTRQDLSLNLLHMERESYSTYYNYYDPYNPYLSKPEEVDGINTITVEGEFVHDNTLWSYTGPATGSRYRLNVEHSPDIGVSDISFTTVEADYRKYFRIGNDYTIVTRFSGGASTGRDPRMFFVGGTSNWLNARVSRISEHLETSQDIFFSRFRYPLRGYRYYELYGQRYFLTNFEFRFPFIDYLAFGWPLPLVLGNISGVLFTDIASAWYRPVGVDSTGELVYDTSFHGASTNESGFLELDDIKMSWGVGMRMDLGFAVLRLDTAWRTTIADQEPSPMFNVSLGPDF